VSVSTASLTARLVALDDLAPRSRVVVGCSGGADSLALLHLASARGLVVTAVYVDHGLRPGTAFDAEVVADAARRAGADFAMRAITVGGRANLEARARAARYDALGAVRAEIGAEAVLVGHTRDDQAETVLLNLLRGSAAAGLAGMPARRDRVRRPLLRVRRSETRELCAQLGFAPVHDPMNDDLHHRRVWLRREVLPMLERGAGRDLVEVLARQADVLRDDDALLDALAREHRADDVAVLCSLPDALARRAVRQWIGTPPPSLATVERVLAVARGDAVGTELPGGDRVRRVGGRLVRIAAAPARSPVEAPVALGVPGRAAYGGLEIEAWVEHAAPVAWPDGRWAAVVDADLVPAAVEVGPGPASGLPVVSDGNALWSVGYRVERRVRVSTATRRYLWLSAEPINE